MKKKATEEKKPFAEAVAERIIEALKTSTAPWQKKWEPGRPGATLPFNPTTGNHYKGINSLVLLMSGYSDTRWMTFKQARDIDACVRKGEKGTAIQYWSFGKTQVKKDDSGNPVKGSDGKSVKETVKFGRPRVFTATVFNAEQIDGLPELVVDEPKEMGWNNIERAERILEESGARIDHINNDRAFYRPSSDLIVLPEKSQFESADGYYATAIHELGHWTGHPTRLNRDLSGGFGSESYAKEELRAEIASMMVGDMIGVGHDPGNHVAYVKSWIRALENDPLEIFRAASDAEKIRGYIMDFELDPELRKSNVKNNEKEDEGLEP